MKKSVFAIVALIAASGWALEITAPKDGAVESLQTEGQREYLSLSREARAEYFVDGREMWKKMKAAGSLPRPVKIVWRDDGGKPVKVRVLELPARREVWSFGGVTNEVEVCNLKIACEYAVEVNAGGKTAACRFKTADLAPRFMKVDHIANMRDLGGRIGLNGCRVKQGLIYRSAGWNSNAQWTMKKDPKHPGKKIADESIPPTPGTNRLTAAGREYALKVLNIRSDIDLRKDSECWGMKGSPIDDSVTWFHYSYLGYSETVYRPAGKQAFADVFRVMLDERNYPMVFHCIGGADRTGTLAFILNALLGCEEDELYKDWEVTGFATRGLVDAKHKKWFDHFVARLNTVNGKTLLEKTENFVKICGFTDEDIEKFRMLMLQDYRGKKVVRRRAVPVEPLLSEISPQTGSITFYDPDSDGTKSGCEMIVSACGIEKRASVGIDGKANVQLGTLPEGRHALKVRIVGADGTMLGENHYRIRVRKPFVEKCRTRRLNNLVEAVENVKADGDEIEFVNPRDGWVHAMKGTSERMAWLERGRRRLKLSGQGKTRVHLVKTILHGGTVLAESKSVNAMEPFDLDFHRLHVLHSFNVFCRNRINNTAEKTFADEIRNAGAMIAASWSLRVRDPMHESIDAMVKSMRAVDLDGCGMLDVDEVGLRSKREWNRNVGEAMWRMIEGGMEVPYAVAICDVIGEKVRDSGALAAILSAAANSGDGRGVMCTEHYLCALESEGPMRHQLEMVAQYVDSVRRIMPSAPAHTVYFLGTYLKHGDWTPHCSPEVDMKAVQARLIYLIATDPRFADAGGVAVPRFYCDEETARWCCELVRYYAIDGGTEDFGAKHGFKCFPSHMNNGDFSRGLEGWKLEVADGGGITVTNKPGFGKREQGRIGGGKCGDAFVVFTRGVGSVNRLKRKICGLTVGKLYSLEYVTADYDEILKPGTRTVTDGISAEVDGGEMMDVGSYRAFWPPERWPSGRKSRNPVIVTNKRVFRALESEATVTFSDAEMRPGTRRLMNFVGVRPYFK